MQHRISTSAAALVIGSTLAFPVGPAAAQKTMNEGGQAQTSGDQGSRGPSRGAAAESRGGQESRGAPSTRESRGTMRSESNTARGQGGAQARTGAEIRGGARADTGPRGQIVRGEASFRERGTVTSRTGRDMDNRRFVDRDRGFVDRDRRFVERDRSFVDRDRSFVDRDVRSRTFAVDDDRRLDRRIVRGRSFASEGTDVRYVGGTRPFAYRSYDDEPMAYRVYGDTGYAYPPSYPSTYADVDLTYDAPRYRGLYAYSGDDPTYMSADWDYNYGSRRYPLLNTVGPACNCAAYR